MTTAPAFSESVTRVLDGITDSILVVDTDWRLSFINAAARRLLAAEGLGREELIGKHFWNEAFPQARGTAVESEYRRAMAGRVACEFEYFFAAWQRWLEIRVYPIDEGGLSICFQDITERKHAREQERRAAAEAVESAKVNARFRTAFEQGTYFAGIMDLDGTLVEANRLSLEVVGLTREEVIGKRFWDCGWWNRSPALMALVCEATRQAAAGSTFRQETEYFVADGSRRCVELTIAPVKDEAGRVMFLIPTGTDITERKRAEKALRESEEFNRIVLESSPDCVKILDCEGRLQFMNHSGACLLEIDDLAPFINQPWWATLAEENAAMVKQAVAKAARGEPAHFQASCPTAKGTLKWWDVRVAPMANEQGGKPVRLISVARDITESRRAEQAAREAGERYQTLFNSIDEGFCVIEVIFDEQQRPQDYRFLEVNPAFEKQTGLRQAQGRRIREFAPEHEEHWFEIYGRIALTGEPARFENRAAALDRWYDVFAFRVGEPEQRRVALLFNDISARKRTEEALEKAQNALLQHNQILEQTVQQRTAKLQETILELESFSYSISHDLRSPLRAMQGYADALLQEYGSKLAPEAAHYLDRIHRAASRLDLLVRDVLAYSKVAKEDVQLKTIDLELLIAEIVQNYPDLHPSKVRVVAARLPKVMGHEGLLTQIIANLLGNAVKFSAPGKLPEVRVTGEWIGADVRIWLVDEGIGIAPEHHEQIFKIFGRVHPDKKYEGTGIGLAIVKKAAERMGGSVGVRSELGKGSRFWITLRGSP